jgi:carbon dioxide concentrating mechanism protein CcmN
LRPYKSVECGIKNFLRVFPLLLCSLTLSLTPSLLSQIAVPMYLPPLQLNRDLKTCVSGDVEIDPSAAIAPGVILQAEPDSRIKIAPGVCIGMGAILHARGGAIEVETGAVIGAGVLAIGQVKIGANACIGATTTIIDRSIAAQQVVSPGSLVGETGRPSADPSNATKESEVTPPNPQPKDLTQESDKSTVAETTSISIQKTKTQVYGQAHLNRMLESLFPHRNAITSLPSDPPPQIEGDGS